MAKENTKTVAVKNTTGKIYNGYKVGQILFVTDPRRYLLEGWSLIDAQPSENTEPKVEKTKAELKAEAEKLGINTNGMNKDQLAEAIANAQPSENTEPKEDETDPDLENELE